MSRKPQLLACPFFLVMLCFAASAGAQQMIGVRTGEHETYSRVVFDWTSPVTPRIEKLDSQTLKITFNMRADLDLSEAIAVRLESIRRIEQLAAPSGQTVARVTITPGSRYRTLKSGNRVVLDVYHAERGKVPEKESGADSGNSEPPSPPGQKPDNIKLEQAEPENQSERKTEAGVTDDNAEGEEVTEEPVTEEDAPAASEDDADQPEPENQGKASGEAQQEEDVTEPDAGKLEAPEKEEAEGAETEATDPETKSEQVIEPPVEKLEPAKAAEEPRVTRPHVVNISATETVAVASFTRNGFLWMILDRPDVSIKPQIAGPQKDLFENFRRVDMEDGTAFGLKLPEGMHVYGEGGGLLWRLIISPYDREVRAAEAQRRFRQTRALRNGSLFWLLPSANKVLEFTDPETQETLSVVPVYRADEFAGRKKEFVDLVQLNSPLGLALHAKTDGVVVAMERPGVLVTHPKGLALLSENAIASRKARTGPDRQNPAAPEDYGQNLRIFNFERWQMGGHELFNQNQRVLLAGMTSKDKTGVVEDLITLGKLNMSNNRGAEAVGYFDLAAQKLPGLLESPEFIALRGAARALARRYELAFKDFSNTALDAYKEVRYWRTYALAGLEDWQQAETVQPDGQDILKTYPFEVRVPLGLTLAESALRAGNVEKGERLLAMVERDSNRLEPHQKKAWNYLAGEARRQRGNPDEAKELWQPLVDGFDELYRAKAGLAMTELLLRQEEIDVEEAIDRMESLRYVWRGDELEARINYRLGLAYIENEGFVKGLLILRDAVSMAPETRLGRRIAAEMSQTFQDLFLTDKFRKLTPLEAISLYEQFPELTPAGEEGDRLVERLAETLVEADLLERASEILTQQVEHRLEGEEKLRVAVRLAAIRLLNREPGKALDRLTQAEELSGTLEPTPRMELKQREIRLLRARALSDLGRPIEALNILADMDVDPDLNRLRADIAWKSAEWDEAADALEQMIQDAGVNPVRPLTQYQAELILNRAVALNLAENRLALSQLREVFGNAMQATPRARIFDLMTRPRKSSILADRETMRKVVQEVDIFQDFLNTYRKPEPAAQVR